jgi:alpha-D-ribose 1-methylphosphonate 5-phosphate C-P lyase
MSLNETSNLIAQSRKIIESGQDDTTNSNTLLNIILQIVTSIDTRVQRMEINIEKRIDDLNQSMLAFCIIMGYNFREPLKRVES